MEKTCRFEVEIGRDQVLAFADLSGDRNPLHVDEAYAKTTEFGRPIAHGALLAGLVSRVLGMHIPGTESLILSMRLQFPKPLFYPARVRVEGLLQDFNEDRRTGLVRVVATDEARAWSVLEADVGFALHGHQVKTPQARPSAGNGTATPRAAARRRLLVTGGTGGVGAQLLAELRTHYDFCCLTRRPEAVRDDPSSRGLQVDLDVLGQLETSLARESPADYYGILHLSVAPMGRGFVSDDLDAVRRHWRHSVEVPLALAQWARRPGSAVKRIVLFGSTAGSRHPTPHAGAYSLGKAAMEHAAKLLTADLAPQGATINVVLPTAVPVGLNAGMSERARLSLAAKMPTGRLVEPRDLARVTEFLLSDAAGQINGSAIAVDGGLWE